MARKKKKVVNKNLVAMLTVFGIFGMVGVTYVASAALNRSDPEDWVARAKLSEDKGDFERAIQFFDRAYRVSKDPDGSGKKDARYRLHVARVAYKAGMVFEALAEYRRVVAERPADPEVLEKTLDYYWELRRFNLVWGNNNLRDELKHAEALLELSPDNVLALCSKAICAYQLRTEEPELLAVANAAVDRAASLEPDAPRVALVRLIWATQDEREYLSQHPFANNEDRREALRDKLIAICQPVLAQHPDNVVLTSLYVNTLLEMKLFDDALAAIDRAIQAVPDSAEFHLDRARCHYQRAVVRRDEVEQAELDALLDRARAEAQKVIDIEPALLAGYRLLALTNLVTPTGIMPDAEDLEATLQTFVRGFEESLGVRSARAAIAEYRLEPLEFAVQGFNIAGTYPVDPENIEPGAAKRREWSERFLDIAEGRYSDNALTHFMRGRFHMFNNEYNEAIVSLSKAHEAVTSQSFIKLFGQLPSESLARLYREQGQIGEALKWTNAAISDYTGKLELNPPIIQYLNKAEILNELEQYREALDLLNRIRPVEQYANDPRILRVMAISYMKLERPDDALQALRAIKAPDDDTLLQIALTAADAGADEDAERTFQQLLDRDPANQRVIGALAGFLDKRERRGEIPGVLAALKSRNPDEQFHRWLDSLATRFTTTSMEERIGQLEQIAAQETDPFTRAVNYYNLYYFQNNLEEAQKWLDDAEKHRPDDRQVLEFQMAMAVRRGEFERAQKYAAKLGQQNADSAGGATYRGAVFLAEKKYDQAIQELLDAQAQLPVNSALQVKLARSYHGLGRVDEALVALNRAKEANPRDAEVHKLYYMIYRDQGETALAHEAIVSAAKLAPNDAEVLRQRELMDEEADPRKGIGIREKRRETDPTDVENLVRLVKLYDMLRREALRAGRPDMAETVRVKADARLREALKLEPGSLMAVAAAADFYAEIREAEPGIAAIRGFIEQKEGMRKVAGQVMLARFSEKLGDLAATDKAFADAREMVNRLAENEDQKRIANIRLGFELVDYQTRTQQSGPAEETARWLLAQLRPDVPAEHAQADEIRLRLISSLIDQKRYGDSEQELNDYVKRNPRDTRGLMLRADYHLRTGDSDQAYADFTSVLAINPDDIVARYGRGDLALRLRRYAEARNDLAYLKKLVVKWRGTALADRYELDTRSRLARLFEVTGEVELAEAELRELLEWLSDRVGVENLRQANADRLLRLFETAGRERKAEDVAAEYMAKYPQNAYWPYKMAELLMEREQFSAAASFYQKAIDLLEGNSPYIEARCQAQRLRALTQSNRALEARAVFDGLPADKRTPQVRISIAETFEALGDSGSASEAIQQGLVDGAERGGPTLSVALVPLSERLSAAEFGAACARAEAATSSAVAKSRLKNAAASKYLATDEYPPGLQLVEQVLASADPQSPEYGDALVIQAQLMDASGKVTEAVSGYERLLERNQDNVSALNNLAYLLATKGDRPEMALQYSQRAVDLMSGNPPLALMDTHAWVLYKNSRYDEAEVIMKEVLSIDPGYLPTIEHLAQMFQERGRAAEARQRFRQLRERAKEAGDEQSLRVAEEALSKLQ